VRSAHVLKSYKFLKAHSHWREWAFLGSEAYCNLVYTSNGINDMPQSLRILSLCLISALLCCPTARRILDITCLLSRVWLFNCVERIKGERLYAFCSLINSRCLTIVNILSLYVFCHMSLVIDLPAYPESPSTFLKASALANVYIK
jgi:hypothetical protein